MTISLASSNGTNVSGYDTEGLGSWDPKPTAFIYFYKRSSILNRLVLEHWGHGVVVIARGAWFNPSYLKKLFLISGIRWHGNIENLLAAE